MAQTYQINYDARTDILPAVDTLSSVLQNAVPQGLTMTALQYVAAQGRIRVTLSAPLSAEEVESFAGTIIAL